MQLDAGPADDSAATPPDAATTASTIADGAGPTGHDGATGIADSAPAADGTGTTGCDASSDAGAIAAVHAWPGPTPPTIDGNLSDWVCEDWHPLTAATAAYASDPATPIAASIAVAWDAQNVYVAMRVVDPSVGSGGYDPVNPYDNASAEVYVSGDAVLHGDYDSQTHHYVTDYRGLSVDYGPAQAGGPADTVHAHYVAAATTVAGGWSFEGAVGWPALLAPGTKGFGAGINLALDFEVNSGDGSTQTATLIFSLASARPDCECTQACCCGQPTDVPTCDTTQFARLTLE